MTIHNIAYQGDGVGGYLWDAMIPARHHPMLNHGGLSDNLLAIGIAYADMISTVSPRYAQEIQYQYAGYNLADLIQTRADDLIGILNGLDDKLWHPANDPTLIENYDIDTIKTKRLHNKRHLQAFARLPLDDSRMVIGIVSRLTWQKGFDLAIPALRQFLHETDNQFIILGTGDTQIMSDLKQLEQDFPEQVAAFLEFDAALAQQIYAGSDLFLMPSHFEPCGIGQLIAMKYGALPLVRETGGLADTVVNYDDGEGANSTGFVFKWEEVGAVLGTLRWADDTYRNRREVWYRMQQNAMSQDFNWFKSAEEYVTLYQRAIRKQREVGIEG
jgi:starch synthase